LVAVVGLAGVLDLKAVGGVHEDGVDDLAGGAFVEAEHGFVGGGSLSDEGAVGDEGTGFGGTFAVAEFEEQGGVVDVFFGLGSLDAYQKLQVAVVAQVKVEGVVAVVGGDEVSGVYGAAEKFKAVVAVGDDFDVFEGGSSADTSEGESVDFVAGTEQGAAVANGYVAQYAGVVVGVAASVDDPFIFGGVYAFDVVFAFIAVNRGVSKDDDSSPKSVGFNGYGALQVVAFDGKDDGLLGGAVGDDFATAGYDEGTGFFALSGFCTYYGAGFNGEGLPVVDVHFAVEEVVFVGGPCGGAGTTAFIGDEGVLVAQHVIAFAAGAVAEGQYQ